MVHEALSVIVTEKLDVVVVAAASPHGRQIVAAHASANVARKRTAPFASRNGRTGFTSTDRPCTSVPFADISLQDVKCSINHKYSPDLALPILSIDGRAGELGRGASTPLRVVADANCVRNFPMRLAIPRSPRMLVHRFRSRRANPASRRSGRCPCARQGRASQRPAPCMSRPTSH